MITYILFHPGSANASKSYICLHRQGVWFKEMKLGNTIFDCIFYKLRKYEDNEMTSNPMTVLGKALTMYSYII